MVELIIPIVVVVVVVTLCYYFLQTKGNNTSAYIVQDVQSGKKEIIDHKKVKPSDNEPGGLQFSYTGWIRIDDFTYRYGAQKVIFVKGSADMATACPAFLIDANTNSLLLKMDTFGAQETISIVSVPSKKWLHFAIVVDQEALKVYINGIMYAQHTLTQLPRQNSGALLVSPGGGFDGKIVSLQYQPIALTGGDVQRLSAQAPPLSSEKGTQVLPPYFDFSWFKP
jgi:hypothetical protein